MSQLTSDQIKVLEQSRQRLVQLTRSLGSLIASLNQSDPLPPWCAAPDYDTTKPPEPGLTIPQVIPPVPSKHHFK
jgi:hypothetical protein